MCIPFSQFPQSLPATGQPRPHRADGYFKYFCGLVVCEALKSDEQYRTTLVFRKTVEGLSNVPTLDVVFLVGRSGSDGVHDFWGSWHLASPSAPPMVDMSAIQHAEQPAAETSASPPQVLFAERPFETVLHQVVGLILIATQGHCEASKVRNLPRNGPSHVIHRNFLRPTAQAWLSLYQIQYGRIAILESSRFFGRNMKEKAELYLIDDRPFRQIRPPAASHPSAFRNM